MDRRCSSVGSSIWPVPSGLVRIDWLDPGGNTADLIGTNSAPAMTTAKGPCRGLVTSLLWNRCGREADVPEARRIADRYLIAGGGSWLIATFVGGALMAVVEGVGMDEGLWIAFSAVSTTGYVAPSTPAGRGIIFIVFASALMSYVLLATGAVLLARATAWDRPKRRVADTIPEDDIRRVVEAIRMN